MNLCWSCSNQWVLRQLMLKFVVLVLLLGEISSCLKFSCCLLSINFDYEQTLSSPRPYWGSFSRWPVTFVIISWSVLNFSIRRRALQLFCSTEPFVACCLGSLSIAVSTSLTLFSYKDTYPPTLSALQHSIFTKQPFIPSHGFLALRIRFNPMKWFYCGLFFTAASWSHSSAFSWTDRHCAAYTNRAFSSLVKHSRFT